MWILFSFNADPDLEFFINTDPGPVSNPDVSLFYYINEDGSPGYGQNYDAQCT